MMAVRIACERLAAGLKELATVSVGEALRDLGEHDHPVVILT
jgi:hypothetical protein